MSGSAPIRPGLITAVRETFGVSLQALWGMTENGCVTITRPDDPPGWTAHSDGRPLPWMQVRVAPDEETVREHARRGGFPANRVSAVRRMIDPDTAH